MGKEVVEEVFGVGELEGAQESDGGEEVGFEGFNFQLFVVVGGDGGVLGDGFSVALLEVGSRMWPTRRPTRPILSE